MKNEAEKLYISRDVFGVKPGDVTRAYIKDDPSDNPAYLAVFSQEKKFLGLIPYKKYFLANLTDFTLLGSSRRSLRDMKQVYNKTIANPKAISENYRPLYQNYSDLLAIKKQLTGELLAAIVEDGSWSGSLVLSQNKIYVDVRYNGKLVERQDFAIYENLPAVTFSDWDAKSKKNPELSNRHVYWSSVPLIDNPKTRADQPFQSTELPENEEITKTFLIWQFHECLWSYTINTDSYPNP